MLLTHIYEHYTFENSQFKIDFIMNQKSRQKATSSVERDFLKLLHNRNFAIHCENNIDNCILESLDDGFTEISHIKTFTTIFNSDTFSNFFSPTLLRQEIIQTFQSRTFPLNKDEPTY